MLPHHSLDTFHHLFPHPPDFPVPCVLLNLSNILLYNTPHPNLCLNTVLLLHPLCNCDTRWAHGGLGVGEHLSIAVANGECAVDLFFVWKVIPTKNRIQKKLPGKWEPTTTLSAKHIAQNLQGPHSLTDQKQSHLFKIESGLTVVYIFHFHY